MRRYPKIVGITGLPASGKTEGSKIIEDMGIPIIRMGDVVRKDAPRTEEIGRFADLLREKEGMDAIAKRSLPRIKEILKDRAINIIMIEGIRNLEEVKFFKSSFSDNFILIAIESPDRIRFKRVLKRKREDITRDFESFKRRDTREMNWGIDRVIEMADIKIKNDSSLEDLKKKVRDVVEMLV
ncbi:MAG: hypothetical protein MOIL_01422 [Candidatus Methanolliviera sp. GoM_oil]|nr:MAG: hypothetical protein MOIL_01422 [Candidatus Methanolliviera sp. GoM_oil]